MIFKVNIFNKMILKQFFTILSGISVVTTLIFLFVSIPEKNRFLFSILFFLLIIIIYFGLWIYANIIKTVKIKINNSLVVIKVGDIFKENGLKVIAFNEYFDTIVDEKIISSSSLNGIFIKKFISNINLLNKEIRESTHLLKRRLENDKKRPKGNTQKYILGSIHQHENFLLTAFSKFDEDNRAYLLMNDYINCLLNFWNEIDIIYANRSVVVPLLGNGITRFRNYEEISEQEKLELLLWSLKVSKIKFSLPAKITIVIHKSIQDSINFYRLKIL